MKTIEEIKNEVAVKHGYKDWLELCHHYQYVEFSHDEFNGYLNEVATEYAKQCCDEQIRACAENKKEDNLQRYLYEQSKEFTTNGLTFKQVLGAWKHGDTSISFIESLIETSANKYSKDKILNTPNVVTTN